MDKSSPVFENFMNKMSTMQGQGRPKMNRNTFKIGSGGLETRVANNEKKITTLKNIFKAQRVQIGEKLTPKVNVLEESLIRTNAIITDVAAQLEKDFSQRLDAQKALLAKERQNKLDDKRQDKEGRIEAVKVAKFVKSTASTVTRPFKNIFEKILDFGKLFLAGAGVNAALSWLANPQNLLKFQNMLKLIAERPFISLAAFGGLTLIITTVVSKLVGALRKVVFSFFNPIAWKNLFTGKTFKNFLPNMKKLIDKAGKRTTKGFLLKKVGTKLATKTGLKALGALPLIGNFIDIGSAIYRFSKGDIVGGFLSLGSAIPVLGWGIAAIDVAREFGAFEGSILQKHQVDSKKATGGDFVSGERMLVGERGPEIVQFDRSGTVIPNHTLKNLARNRSNNFGNGPKITTVNLPDQVINKPISQTGVTEDTQEDMFVSGSTDTGNKFHPEFVTYVGGIA